MKKEERIPKYKAGRETFKVAHGIRNIDVVTLHEFFNPKMNQGCIYGFTHIDQGIVPKFLDALGYDITWDDDGNMWTAHIPEHFRTKEITVKKRVNW